MVWGLFPAEPLSGENRYYIFSEGTYKVGRKGCDVIINKDKGVSRVHAEIVIDAMIALDTQRSTSRIATKVRIRDCSKYGTFINKDLVSKKCMNFPAEKQLCKMGTWCLLELVMLLTGASAIRNWSMECTHVLVDDITPFNVDVVDAIVGKKPLVCHKWVEFIAESNICTEIPCCSSHAPTLKVEDLSVKFADSVSRENCLRGYTFLLQSALKYQLKDRLLALLEVSGAKVIAVEAFYQSTQDNELDSAKAEMHEVREENKRLGTYLDKMMKDYQSLTQFNNIVHEKDSPKKSPYNRALSHQENRQQKHDNH